MDPIAATASILKLEHNHHEKHLQWFDVPDPFNDNTLQGYLCRYPDYRYGAIVLWSVNNIPCKIQVIYGTPKMGYPFDKTGKYRWPACKHINVYEKLDGTNVLAYSYEARKKTYVTYKTRLTPVVRGGKWGDFEGMWRDMLEKYPGIPDFVARSGLNLSFELVGARNHHLIVYDFPLDIRLLFGVTESGDIKDLDHISFPGIPQARKEVTIRSDQDITSFYKKLQGECEALNKATQIGIEGSEGYIFYAHCEDGSVKQLKLKPSTIEQIHWAAGGPSTASIRTTCQNAFENWDDVTVDRVKELLCEEFDWRIVEKKHRSIEKILADVYREIKLRDRILEVYREENLDLLEDKRGTMRALSKHFAKGEMGYVYWLLSSNVG